MNTAIDERRLEILAARLAALIGAAMDRKRLAEHNHRPRRTWAGAVRHALRFLTSHAFARRDDLDGTQQPPAQPAKEGTTPMKNTTATATAAKAPRKPQRAFAPGKPKSVFGASKTLSPEARAMAAALREAKTENTKLRRELATAEKQKGLK